MFARYNLFTVLRSEFSSGELCLSILPVSLAHTLSTVRAVYIYIYIYMYIHWSTPLAFLPPLGYSTLYVHGMLKVKTTHTSLVSIVDVCIHEPSGATCDLFEWSVNTQFSLPAPHPSLTTNGIYEPHILRWSASHTSLLG